MDELCNSYYSLILQTMEKGSVISGQQNFFVDKEALISSIKENPNYSDYCFELART